MKILPLTGYRSLKALNGFNALLLGLKMLPVHQATAYEEFFESFGTKSDAQKENMLREAVAFVQLAQDEVEALVCFATDPNGIPYSAVNVKNLNFRALHEIIVAVCMEIGRISIDLVTAEEKKLGEFAVDVRQAYLRHPNLSLSELLNFAFLEAVQYVHGNSQN